mgnify:CR=1 FL=1|jgi:hypothetical protein
MNIYGASIIRTDADGNEIVSFHEVQANTKRQAASALRAIARDKGGKLLTGDVTRAF